MVARITHQTWGEWPSVRLATDAVELEVVGEVGARVVSLRDKRRDREWLAQGRPPTELEQMAWSSEDAVFGGRESFGWDECLPTTAPCADPTTPGAPALRDHGDQWGRGAYLSLDEAQGAVVHSWSVPRWPYRLSRRLSFEDEQTVSIEYLLVSMADTSLPIAWAQHPVLQLERGSALDLPGVTDALCSWRNGIDLPDALTWPTASLRGGGRIDLSCVGGGEGWAAVLYTTPLEEVRAVAPDGARLDMDWDRQFAPVLRVWLSNGGWPLEGEPQDQVALEPCTSPHDHLEGAMLADRQLQLDARGELRWWVRFRLS